MATKPSFILPSQEMRDLTVEDMEIRADDDDSSVINFRGTAVPFNHKTDIMGGLFREQFLAGAFTKTIVESDIRMLDNHDPQRPLARNRAGNLTLTEEPNGLRTVAQWPRTTYALDLAENIRTGNINSMSIGFRSIREEWDESGKTPLRSVSEAALFDVSTVTYPAYKATTASVRSEILLPSLLDMLGMSDMPDEQRNQLLMQVKLGEVSGEFVDTLRSAQEHLATFTQRAGEPPAGAEDRDAEQDSPHEPDSEEIASELRRRRFRLRQLAG